MAFFIPALVGALTVATGSIVGRTMLAIGLGAVTYTGITASIGVIKDQAISNLSGLPADVANLLGFFWIDKGLTVIFSATAVALTMKTINGSLKKIVMK